MATPSPSPIRWPREFLPANAPVFAHNELNLPVPPEAAWAWLVRATVWPSYYPNSANVRYENEPGSDLRPGTRFRWKTFGANLLSEVVEFEPCHRLAWTADGLGIRAYHAWLLEPTPTGCRIVTEETQHGWLCRLGKLLFPGRMERQHQVWLEQLSRVAQAGPPPAP